ncbi:MAG: hypothetical protein Q7P63_07000 [Verrucomicrobiota bacterium JB022]|nr:hypothetical protein [Verrucomicrobiota bacterium JB022]
MDFHEELRQALTASETDPSVLVWLESSGRFVEFERLAEASPLYFRLLVRQPQIVAWLADTGAVDLPFGAGRYATHWRAFAGEVSGEALYSKLRQFRRWHSLRIAWREVNELAPMRVTLRELSSLADFCLQKVFEQAWAKWEQKLGTPWDEELDQPAKLGVLGLGKLGSEELNFCSDVDLMFLSEGRGHVKRGDRLSGMANGEFFTRVGQEFLQVLTRRTADGFLYNVDLRLRPEGAAGQLITSVGAAVNYYFARGQTWERMMLLKARAVAGDKAVCGEFLELVHTFRYPRHPPASLPQDVATLKQRMEKEVVGTNRLQLNLKNGYGGIREIEFFAQILQLVHAGRFPFLQTASTREAIRQLTRYNLIAPELRTFLIETYDLLRRLEHRAQMRDEQQTHDLPPPGPERARLAKSMDYPSVEAFEADLQARRDRVRHNYQELFPHEADHRHEKEWADFLTTAQASPFVEQCIRTWFGPHADAAKHLHEFILGSPDASLTREHVMLFADLAANFGDAFQGLSRPLRTLRRISRFAERYGARKQFLKTCGLNPSFFRVLCLLFDRSEFIFKLLCQHPEIMEELLVQSVRRQKSRVDLLDELRHGPTEREAFRRWLWLFVKAEQVRASINGLLEDFSLVDLERQLTALSDAALTHTLQRVDPEGRLLIVALGKYGGEELALGSDLDLLLIGPEGESEASISLAQELNDLIAYKEQDLGRTFDLDFRLRPHGQDGPLVTTLPALQRYHEKRGQTWERQMLTRARVVAGNPELETAFEAWRQDWVYERPFTEEESADLDHVRERILKEKARTAEQDYRGFKVGRGGLLDIEFLAQRLQLQHGRDHPSLRTANTRAALEAMAEAGLLSPERLDLLRKAYTFYRRIELHLRREAHEAVSELPEAEAAQQDLAVWMRLTPASFLQTYRQHRREVATVVSELLPHLEPALTTTGQN